MKTKAVSYFGLRNSCVISVLQAVFFVYRPLARLIVWNVMWTIVFGRSCEISPAQIKHVLDQISRNNKENSMLQAIQLFPKQW